MQLTVHVVQQYHSKREHICCIEGCPHVNFIVTALTCICLPSIIIQYTVFITITMELTVQVVQVMMELRCL